jgi:hypothetical protein
MNRLDRILEFLIAHPVQREIQTYRRARIEGIIQRQWAKEELANEQKRLGMLLSQEVRDFESKTGLKVTGMKIKRDKQGVESVVVKTEMPE